MSLQTNLQSLIEAECAQANIHGMLSRVFSGSAGVDCKGGAGAAQPSSRFLIESTPKILTATLIVQLVEERRIRRCNPFGPILTFRGCTPYYSDTNYQLFGIVIEAVTGQTYDQALQSRSCQPLGLMQTGVLQDTSIEYAG